MAIAVLRSRQRDATNRPGSWPWFSGRTAIGPLAAHGPRQEPGGFAIKPIRAAPPPERPLRSTAGRHTPDTHLHPGSREPGYPAHRGSAVLDCRRATSRTAGNADGDLTGRGRHHTVQCGVFKAGTAFDASNIDGDTLRSYRMESLASIARYTTQHQRGRIRRCREATRSAGASAARLRCSSPTRGSGAVKHLEGSAGAGAATSSDPRIKTHPIGMQRRGGEKAEGEKGAIGRGSQPEHPASHRPNF